MDSQEAKQDERMGLMAQDIRLDFITGIDDEFINMMTKARADFIKMDNELRALCDMPEAQKDGVQRCLSIARTHIETACQYAIKSLCLMGEQQPMQCHNGD